jgi:hypothetical protein
MLSYHKLLRVWLDPKLNNVTIFIYVWNSKSYIVGTIFSQKSYVIGLC